MTGSFDRLDKNWFGSVGLACVDRDFRTLIKTLVCFDSQQVSFGDLSSNAHTNAACIAVKIELQIRKHMQMLV